MCSVSYCQRLQDHFFFASWKGNKTVAPLVHCIIWCRCHCECFPVRRAPLSILQVSSCRAVGRGVRQTDVLLRMILLTDPLRAQPAVTCSNSLQSWRAVSLRWWHLSGLHHHAHKIQLSKCLSPHYGRHSFLHIPSSTHINNPQTYLLLSLYEITPYDLTWLSSFADAFWHSLHNNGESVNQAGIKCCVWRSVWMKFAYTQENPHPR